jgi:phosphoglycolate phosphatase
MPYRLANFDLDGTLLRRLSVVSRHRQRGRGQTRFRRIAPDQVEALRGRDTREIIKFLGVSAWRITAIACDMRRLKAARCLPALMTCSANCKRAGSRWRSSVRTVAALTPK